MGITRACDGSFKRFLFGKCYEIKRGGTLTKWRSEQKEERKLPRPGVATTSCATRFSSSGMLVNLHRPRKHTDQTNLNAKTMRWCKRRWSQSHNNRQRLIGQPLEVTHISRKCRESRQTFRFPFQAFRSFKFIQSHLLNIFKIWIASALPRAFHLTKDNFFVYWPIRAKLVPVDSPFNALFLVF